MADWHLTFRESRRITCGMCEGVVSALVGGPVTASFGPLVGNPRDFYCREATLTADHPDGLQIAMKLTQDLRGPDDPETVTHLGEVILRGPAAAFATKRRTWHQLREALAAIGCADRTLAARPAPIVDDAEAAGDRAVAARLRAEITAALVAEAPSCASVALSSPRADDLEAVLAAYVDAEHITDVHLADCGLRTLPAGLGRFPNLASLWLAGDPIDGRAFRGVSLPALTRLTVDGCAIRELSRDDVAGLPGLTELHITNSPLQQLALDLIEACPNLRRVIVAGTPLERDAAQLAALRARWTTVAWGLNVRLPDDPPGRPERAAPARRAGRKQRAPVRSRLDDLLEGIVAARDDDAPRRVYADALIEAGEPQGELIHLQCDLARGGLTRDEGVRRRRRERALLDAHAARWTAALRGLVTDYRFARGLVDEVVITAELWAARGGKLLDAAPALRAITLNGLHEDAQDHGPDRTAALVLERLRRAVASRHLRRLSGLGHSAIGYGHRASQWDLHETESLGERAMQILLAADLAHLRALAVHEPTPAGARALAGAPIVASLERLAIEALDDPGIVLAALAPARIRGIAVDDWHAGLSRFPALRELAILESTTPARGVPPALSHLSYQCRQGTAMTGDDVAAVAASSQLVELELFARELPGWRALEHARFTDLRVLRLISPEVTVEHARALRRWPIADQLEVLQILEASDAERAELEALFGCVVEPRRAPTRLVYAR